ncbi:MAG: endonuclease/exonuclease/phosphatase family protein [Vulcanibacillus sp.]
MLINLLKAISGIILLFVIVLAVFVLYIMITDYKPKDVIPLEINNNQTLQLNPNNTFTISTFNIGYAGLDEGQDFFKDGGTSSRSRSEEQTLINMDKIIQFLTKQASDFYIVQEIDVKASRSYNVNELTALEESLSEYASAYATNYKVPWVPVPVFNPMGHVEGGISTFSKYQLSSSTRYQFPGKDVFPDRLFLLDRCMTDSIIQLDNGKQLIIANLHLSAFDDGSVRAQQIAFVKNYMIDQYEKGNYVIIGGDWNHFLVKNEDDVENWVQELPEDFLPEGWLWAVDESIPTVRANGTSYVEGVSYTTIIDGFLISPNVEIIDVYGHDLKFENSDHNPQTMEFRLKY